MVALHADLKSLVIIYNDRNTRVHEAQLAYTPDAACQHSTIRATYCLDFVCCRCFVYIMVRTGGLRSFVMLDFVYYEMDGRFHGLYIICVTLGAK